METGGREIHHSRAEGRGRLTPTAHQNGVCGEKRMSVSPAALIIERETRSDSCGESFVDEIRATTTSIMRGIAN